MNESMARHGDPLMTAVLLRRLMYPYASMVVQIVHEWWYELVRSCTSTQVHDSDAACVVLHRVILETILNVFAEEGRDPEPVDALMELVACCLQAERVLFDEIDDNTPLTTLVFWHLRTQKTVPDWYARTQRSDAS